MSYYLDVGNFLNIFGTGLILLSGAAVIRTYILPNATPQTLEVAFYTCGIASLTNNKWLFSDINNAYMISLVGQFGLPKALLWSLETRGVDILKVKDMLYIGGALFWGWQSYLWKSQLLGSLSALAFVHGIGGFCDAVPNVLTVGIKKDSILPVTVASGLASFAYMYASKQQLLSPTILEPFRFGALTVLPFFHYLGLLFLSGREGYYDKKFGPNYFPINLLTFGSLCGGYVAGNALGFSYLTNTVKFMSFLYGVEKYYEIPWGDNYLATFILGLAFMFSPVLIKENLANIICGLKKFD